MKEFLVTISMAVLACLALAGCGDDPVIVDAETSGETGLGLDGDPLDSPNLGEVNEEPPALPGFLLEEPYAQYFKEAVGFKELHLGKRQEGVKVDPLDLVFSSGEPDAVLLFRGTEEDPFSGWVKDFRKDGSLNALSRFKKGKQDGLMLSFYDDGQLKTQGYYSEGFENDEWTYWDRDGNETQTVTYENGRRVEP